MENEQGRRFITALCRLRTDASALSHAELTGMTTGEFLMLNHIMRLQGDTGIRVSDLGQHMRISRSGVSQLLKGLDDKRFIQRLPDKEDRRVVYIRMTEEGEARYARITSGMRNRMHRIIAQMGEQNFERLITLVEKLSEAMEGELDQIPSKKSEYRKGKPDEKNREIF